VVFEPIRDPNLGIAAQDGVNSVIFGDDVYGEPLAEGVLAITLTTYTTSDNVTIETDVVVQPHNRLELVSWRPALRNGRRHAV
jgi:hypothetical protein